MSLDWFRNHFRNGVASKGSDEPCLLAVTPSEEDRNALRDIAGRRNWMVRFADDRDQAERALSEQPFGVILCDRDLDGQHWSDHIERLRAKSPGSCVILISRVNDEYLWEEVVHRGGYDVLTRPLKEAQVAPAVTLAWSYWKGWLQAG